MWKPMLILVAIATILSVFGFKSVSKLKEDNRRLRENQRVLMEQRQSAVNECERYRVADSLSAAKADALRLTIQEYKKYRAQDLKRIKELGVDKSDLEGVVGVQAKSIYNMRMKLADTIDINIYSIKPRKAFDFKSEWADVQGTIDVDSGVVDLNVYTREELKVVESIERKRFLGFLWKTGRIKNRRVDVVSANPNTEINSVELVSIEQ